MQGLSAGDTVAIAATTHVGGPGPANGAVVLRPALPSSPTHGSLPRPLNLTLFRHFLYCLFSYQATARHAWPATAHGNVMCAPTGGGDGWADAGKGMAWLMQAQGDKQPNEILSVFHVNSSSWVSVANQFSESRHDSFSGDSLERASQRDAQQPLSCTASACGCATRPLLRQAPSTRGGEERSGRCSPCASFFIFSFSTFLVALVVEPGRRYRRLASSVAAAASV